MEFSILKLAEMEGENLDEPPEIDVDKTHPLWPGIKASLYSVYDPEIPVNIYELGLVYSVRIDDERQATHVMIDMTLPRRDALSPRKCQYGPRKLFLGLKKYLMSRLILFGTCHGHR